MTALAIGTAFWLGLLTAISPCPLATNITAISFIGRQVGNRRRIWLSGLLYTAGRTVTYVVLGILITAGLLATATVSRILQTYVNEFIGPPLIIVGLILLGWLKSTHSLNLAGEGIQQKISQGGTGWAFVLGILFALSFCPISAALFFVGLIPLALAESSRVILPLCYGIGTALPVIVFAFLIAVSSEYLGRAFNCLTRVERWARGITGTLFILAGLYYSLVYVYAISGFRNP